MVYHQNPGALTDPNQGAKVFAGKVLQPSWVRGRRMAQLLLWLSGERKHLQIPNDKRHQGIPSKI
jgi:hypothetical protein